MKDDPAAFAAVLGALGCAVEPADDRCSANCPPADRTTCSGGWPRRRRAGPDLRPQRSSLEEVFLKAVGGRPLKSGGVRLAAARREMRSRRSSRSASGTGHLRDADLRPGLPALGRPARGARLALARRDDGRGCGSRHAAAARSGSSPRGCPALMLAAVLVFWGLLEQQSGLLQPFMAFSRRPRDHRSGPKAYRAAVWTMAYRTFFGIDTFFACSWCWPWAPTWSARTSGSTRCRCTSPGRCGGSTTSSASSA